MSGSIDEPASAPSTSASGTSSARSSRSTRSTSDSVAVIDDERPVGRAAHLDAGDPHLAVGRAGGEARRRSWSRAPGRSPGGRRAPRTRPTPRPARSRSRRPRRACRGRRARPAPPRCRRRRRCPRDPTPRRDRSDRRRTPARRRASPAGRRRSGSASRSPLSPSADGPKHLDVIRLGRAFRANPGARPIRSVPKSLDVSQPAALGALRQSAQDRPPVLTREVEARVDVVVPLPRAVGCPGRRGRRRTGRRDRAW